MTTQDTYDFSRIAEAIEYINSNYKDQPDLDEVAQNIHLSPFHFQRMFTNWAGVSPKKFLQFITVEHAKKILQQSRSSIADAAFETGLSGTGRLHDLFINIEGMTPGEYKNGGKELRINYHYSNSPFGSVLIASTTKGICYMAFADDRQRAFDELKQLFPNANFTDKKDEADFFYSLDSKKWIKIGTKLLMTYTLPHFMGYRFGLFNYATKEIGGYADFDYFRITDKVKNK